MGLLGLQLLDRERQFYNSHERPNKAMVGSEHVREILFNYARFEPWKTRPRIR